VVLADSPRGCCSSRVRRVLALLCFRSNLILVFHCSRFADGPSFSSGQSVACADGPPGLRGRSARSSRTVRFSRVGSGGSVRFNGRSVAQAGQSAARLRTVRGTLPDGPRGHHGQSALPVRTVRQSLASLLFGSIPPSFFRASACASRNRS
jgi:hypothetical protein